MENNKVIYNGEVVMDLTNDTVTEDTLLAGFTAHDASGRQIIGRADASRVGYDDTETHLGANNVQGAIEQITTKLSTVGTSNEEVIENTAEANIRSLRLVGNGRKSKNLLKTTLGTTTSNGVTLTKNDDGTFTMDGTATKSGVFTLASFYCKAGTYKFIGTPKNGRGTSVIQWRNHDNTANISSVGTSESIVSITEDNTYPIRIYFAQGEEYNNIVFKPMITEDTTVTYDNGFEPYGLILSEGKVESKSKNLLNPTLRNETRNGVTLTYANGMYTLNGTCTTTFVVILENFAVKSGTYRLVGTPNDSKSAYLQWRNQSDNGNVTGDWGTGGNATVEDGIYMIRIYIKEGETYNNVVFKPMIVDANLNPNVAYDDYVPYGYTSINASSILDTDIIGVNDVHDELIVNADGSGKFIKRINSFKVSDATWVKSTNTGNNVFYTVITKLAKYINAYTIPNVISTSCETVTASKLYTNLKSVISVNSADNIYGNSIRIGTGLDVNMTVSEFLNIYGNDTIVYELETPTVTDLTASQVQALLSLKTFTDKTYIKADCENEIGYFVGTEIGQSIADINSTMWNQIKGLSEMMVALQ